MHISKIELENIKSHAHATFEFTKGTTAITGENGAGKTTIIEAIAWALFDVLEYKKEDFVRRGTKTGSVRVTFESGLDERSYVVFRDAGTGYHVTDPRLNTRIANKKDEVARFLWTHLGLEPGTDLRSLFRQAIGVPQGTFTAIFLEGATDRKIAFDRLLKVEEYRQAAEKLRETSKYLDTSIATVREQIARAEGELTRSDTVEQELKKIQQQIETLSAELATAEKEASLKRELVARLDEAEKVEASITATRAEIKYTLERLDSIEKAKVEIEGLRPRIQQQEKLEAELTALRERLAGLKAVEDQLGELTRRLTQLRENYRQHHDRLKTAETKALGADALARLERRSTQLIRELAEKRAHLDRDERFQREIQGGFCPILSEKCLNINPGQTLESFLTTQFTEIRSHINALESEQTTLTAELARTREAQLAASMLAELRKREDELKAEGQELGGKQKELQSRLTSKSDIETQLIRIDSDLTSLADPRGRIRLLEAETAREQALRDGIRSTETHLAALESQKDAAAKALEQYGDASDAATERAALNALEKREIESRTTLKNVSERRDQLEKELALFGELRQGLAGEFQEKERLENVAETTTFIRNTLKEAAPRVARNYVYHVSIEANQMFREIMGDATRSLKWGEDYAVLLEEDGYERPFASLSGGEQMAAALSIRLALLKQLSDIRVAFFDEPTANMDAERRENFAQQISRITNFDQLFVISHDETFDNFVDNVIEVNREKR